MVVNADAQTPTRILEQAPVGSPFKVLVLDGISNDGLKPLADSDRVEITTVNGAISEEKLCQMLPPYHALLVRSATKVTANVLRAGTSLVAVGRAGVGIDNIDVKTATQCGIFVVNSPLGNVVAAAEHTVALIFSLMRHVPAAHKDLVHDRKWNRSAYVGSELKGKILGVLGCGQVGSRVVRIMKSAGMSVVVYDPFMNAQRAETLGVEKVATLKDVFERSDVVTLHLPKTPETLGIVNEAMMMAMRPGGVIVNVARGGILVEADVVKVLQSGHLRGAAIDVFTTEPIKEENPLMIHAKELGSKLIMTPHLGASTEEAQLQVAVEVSEQCLDVFNGKVPSWAVNKCRLISTNQGYELDELAQLTDAAEFVGGMLEQLVDGPVDTIQVTVQGDHFLKMATPQTLAAYAAVGFLRSTSEYGRVNVVNVEELLSSKCMDLTTHSLPDERHSEFRIACYGGTQRAEIRATVSNRLPRDIIIRQFLGVTCHMKLTMGSGKRLLYSLHRDVPGALAKITQVLAGQHINIADCHLARLSQDQKTKSMDNFSPGHIRRGSGTSSPYAWTGDVALALVLIDEVGGYQENRSDDPIRAMRSHFDEQFIRLGSIRLEA